jgi:hypothetical protein
MTLLGRRKHSRYSLAQPVEGSVRVREEIALQKLTEREAVALAFEACHPDERVTLELPGGALRRVDARVAESRPVVAEHGGIHHRLRLVLNRSVVEAAGAAGLKPASGTVGRTGRDEHDDRVATLVRLVPVRLVEVSRGGCRLECSSRLGSGASGLLAVEFEGLMRADDIRVVRCEPRAGAGAVFQIGAELLRTRRLGRRSVRMAVTTILRGERGAGRAMQGDAIVASEEVRPREVRAKSGGRAPPGMSDRGS